MGNSCCINYDCHSAMITSIGEWYSELKRRVSSQTNYCQCITDFNGYVLGAKIRQIYPDGNMDVDIITHQGSEVSNRRYLILNNLPDVVNVKDFLSEKFNGYTHIVLRVIEDRGTAIVADIIFPEIIARVVTSVSSEIYREDSEYVAHYTPNIAVIENHVMSN